MLPTEIVSPLLGLLVGLIVSLTGAGGGVLAIPLLVFGLNLPIQTAGPIGLFAVSLSAGLGAVLHLRDGILRYKAATLMAATGSLLSPVGLWLAGILPNAPLMLAFSGVLSVIAIKLLRQTARPQEKSNQPASPCQLNETRGKLIWTLPCARQLAFAGGLAGLLSGLLGVGGGFIIVPALKQATNLPMKSIVATSMGVLTLISLTGVVIALASHRLDILIALPFALGSIVGTQIGRQLGTRLPAHHLDRAFAALCLIVAAGLLIKGLGRP